MKYGFGPPGTIYYYKSQPLEFHYNVGMVDDRGAGKKVNLVQIHWKLDEENEFSMTGDIWNASKSDIVQGGQCLDTILAYFPHEPLVVRMHAIWERFHLNELKAGSPMQSEWLRQHPLDPEEYRYPKSHYELASKTLARVGLNPDPGYLHNGKPYWYGHAWLTEQLPQWAIDEIRYWESYGEVLEG